MASHTLDASSAFVGVNTMSGSVSVSAARCLFWHTASPWQAFSLRVSPVLPARLPPLLWASSHTGLASVTWLPLAPVSCSRHLIPVTCYSGSRRPLCLSLALSCSPSCYTLPSGVDAKYELAVRCWEMLQKYWQALSCTAGKHSNRFWEKKKHVAVAASLLIHTIHITS